MTKPWPSLDTIHTVVFDFDGVFTDNGVYVDQHGVESVRCSRGDGFAFELIRCYRARFGLPIHFFILSKEKNPVVAARAAKLRLDCYQAVDDKLAFITDYLKKHHPNEQHPFAGVIYLGNDLNDLSVMLRVGFAVAPQDAHPMIKAIASVVLERCGGADFVRLFVEKLLKIDQLTASELELLV